jgi:hypothetical protein
VLKRLVCALLNDGGSCQDYNVDGMIVTGETRSTRKNICPSATLSAKDSTCPGLGWNPCFRVEKPPTNRLHIKVDENLSVCSGLFTRMNDRIVRH